MNTMREVYERTAHLSLNQAEYQYLNGYLNENDWRRYLFLWSWTAPRMGGPQGFRHDRAWQKLGRVGYMRRIDRVRKWCGLSAYGNGPQYD